MSRKAFKHVQRELFAQKQQTLASFVQATPRAPERAYRTAANIKEEEIVEPDNFYVGNNSRAVDNTQWEGLVRNDDRVFQYATSGSSGFPRHHAFDGAYSRAEANVEYGDVDIIRQKAHQCLRDQFAFESFRPYQEEVITAVLRGHDAFVLMATGSGKSLCYQIPALVSGKTAIIISPLISLMQDQVIHMRSNGIEAEFLGEAQTDRFAGRRAINGEYSLVYMTPEKALNWIDALQAMHQKAGICLIAIDESHCVSEWGHNFRPEYRGLSELRDALPDVPLMALTATATPAVQQDIIQNLRLNDDALLVKTTFDRPNLKLTVRDRRGMDQDLGSIFLQEKGDNEGKRSSSKVFDDMTIVYCTTRDDTEKVYQWFQSKGIPSAPYHAGFSTEHRIQAHKDFLMDNVRVLVATNAFGMGVDKPDIRRIIHWGAPKSLEAYYQQIGRSGRDGFPAECILFMGKGDWNTAVSLIDLDRDKTPPEWADRVHAQQMELLKQFHEYLLSAACRRQKILDYFEDTTPVECGNCDNCSVTEPTGPTQDLAKDAYLCIQVVKANTGGRVAPREVLDVLVGNGGRNGEYNKKYGKSAVFGAGKHRDKKWWREFLMILMRKGMLEGTPWSKPGGNWYNRSTILYSVSPPGHDFLRAYKQQGESSEGPVSFEVEDSLLEHVASRAERNRASKGAKQTRQSFDLDPTGKLLREKLRDLRKKIADEQGIPPFAVFSNETLGELCMYRPTNLETFRAIHGIGKQKTEHYGAVFTAAIKELCQSHNMDTDIAKPDTVAKARFSTTQSPDLSTVEQEVLDAWNLGMDIPQIAKMRDMRTAKYVIRPLLDAINKTDPPRLLRDWERFGISEEVRRKIYGAIEELVPFDWRLRPVMDKLGQGAGIGYEEIETVVARYKTESDLAEVTQRATEGIRASTAGESSTKKRSLPGGWNSSSAPFSKKTMDRLRGSGIIPPGKLKSYAAREESRMMATLSTQNVVLGNGVVSTPPASMVGMVIDVVPSPQAYDLTDTMATNMEPVTPTPKYDPGSRMPSSMFYGSAPMHLSPSIYNGTAGKGQQLTVRVEPSDVSRYIRGCKDDGCSREDLGRVFVGVDVDKILRLLQEEYYEVYVGVDGRWRTY